MYNADMLDRGVAPFLHETKEGGVELLNVTLSDTQFRTQGLLIYTVFKLDDHRTKILVGEIMGNWTTAMLHLP